MNLWSSENERALQSCFEFRKVVSYALDLAGNYFSKGDIGFYGLTKLLQGDSIL